MDPKDTVVDMDKLCKSYKQSHIAEYENYLNHTIYSLDGLRKFFIKFCIEAEKIMQSSNKSISIKDIANLLDKTNFENEVYIVLSISGKKISEIPVDKIYCMYKLGDIFMLITTDKGNKIQFVQNDFIK